MAGEISVTLATEEDFEGTPTFASIGGGAGAGKELVTFYQGTASGSRKVTSATAGGFLTTGLPSTTLLRQRLATPTNPESPQILNRRRAVRNYLMFKIFLSDGQDLNSAGLRIRLDDGTNWQDSIIFDDGTLAHRYVGAYPSTESWFIFPFWTAGYIDPNTPGLICGASVYGTLWGTDTSAVGPGLSIPEIGVLCGLATGAAKSENLFLDSLDTSAALAVIGGTESPDSPATFQDFVDYDVGTIGNRIGHVTVKEGVLYVFGQLLIGRSLVSYSPANTSIDTYFNDSNVSIVFPEHRAHPHFQGVEIDLESAGTSVTWTNNTMTGRALPVRTLPFKTIDINATTDVITVTGDVPDNLQAGDILEYQRNDGDVDSIGVPADYVTASDAQRRFKYVSAVVTGISGTLKLYDIGLNGTQLPTSWLEAQNDSGTNRTSLTAGTASPEETHYLRLWNDMRPDLFVTQDTSPSGSFVVNGGTYENWRSWELSDRTTLNGVTYIGLTRMLQKGSTISACIFIDPFIITHIDQTWPLQNTDLTALVESDDPEKISNSVFNFLADASNEGHAIRITVPGTYEFVGNTFPGAWGADDSDTAMILNDSGGLVTLNISGGGDTPTVKNAPNSPENTTVINNNVNVTITNLQVNTEVRVYLAEDFNSPIDTNQIAGIEDVASPTEFSFSTAAGTIVDIVIHNIDYVLPPNNRIKNFTVPTTDTSFPVTQLLDVNFNNP